MGVQHHHPKPSENVATIAEMRQGERRRLVAVLVLTGVTMVGELAAAYMFGSAALLGDAVHMLAHFAAIATSTAAIFIAQRPAGEEKTYRNWRVEVIATLFNGIAMLPLAGYVFWEAYARWQGGAPINAGGVLAVGAIGLVSNLISAALLHRHAKHDLNVRGAFLHMLADSVSSVGVVLAGLAVMALGWRFADPLVAALISAMIVVWAFTLIRDSCRILLESAPAHLRLEEIGAAIREQTGVAEVHDLHVWTITSKMVALTAHVVVCEDMPLSRSEELSRLIVATLDERFDINHATLQFETARGEALVCEHESETEVRSYRPPTASGA